MITYGNHSGSTGENEGEVIVWDVATGKPVFPALQHTGTMLHVEFSPDGRPFLSATGSFGKAIPSAAKCGFGMLSPGRPSPRHCATMALLTMLRSARMNSG